MNLADGITPVTSLKRNSAELIRKARETGKPVIITQNGRATAVLQDVETFERQRKALLLLKLAAQGDQDYRQGKVVSDAEADRRFEARLRELERGG